MTEPGRPDVADGASRPDRASRPDGAPGGLTVAVLGGTGFLGRALGHQLAAEGHRVVTVARRAPQFAAPGPVREMDLTSADPADVAKLLSGESVDAVVNAAGGMWGLTDDQMVAANLTLVDRLIEAVADSGTSARLIQLGSVHEYGLVPIGTTMDESTVPVPVMPYGKLKLRCTEAVSRARREGRVDAVTLRIGNVVGVGQPSVSLLGVVADTLRTAARDGHRAVVETGPLDSMRDFVGLTDTLAAIGAVITAPSVDAPVVNIGSGVARSARDMVRMLIEASGVPTELREAPRDGAPESRWQRLSIDLAERLIGWAPTYGLAGDVKDFWEYGDADSQG